MQRAREILSKLRISLPKCIALTALVSCVLMFKYRFEPPVDVTLSEPISPVSKLSPEEVDAHPAVQSLKKELAKEIGIPEEELFVDTPATEPSMVAEVQMPEDLDVEVAEEETSFEVAAEVIFPTEKQIVLKSAPKKSQVAVAKKKIQRKATKTVATQGPARKPVLFARLDTKKTKYKMKSEMAVRVAPPIDDLLADEGLVVSDAVDTDAPLDVLAHNGLSETDLAEPVISDTYRTAAISLWTSAPEELAPLEPRLALRVGTISPEHFSDLKRSLVRLKEADVVITSPPEKSASRIVELKEAPPVQEEQKVAAVVETSEPVLVAPTTEKVAEKQVPVVEEAPANRSPLAMMKKPEPVLPQKELNEPTSVDESDETASSDPIVVIPEKRVVNETKVAMNTPLDSERMATQGSVEEKSEPVLVRPQIVAPAPVIVAPKVSKVAEAPARVSEPAAEMAVPSPIPTDVPVAPTPRTQTGLPGTRSAIPDANAEGGSQNGLLMLDEEVVKDLQDAKGHVALFHYPAGSIDQAELYSAEYQYPYEDFSFDTRNFKGPHRLVAYFYSPASVQPISIVEFPDFITRDGHKKRIRFRISKADVLAGLVAKTKVTPSHVPLRITLFDGFTNESTQPTRNEKGELVYTAAVKDGFVRFVDFPEYSRAANAQGNVRIPAVPTQSEFLVEVTAPGFMPTETIISVGNTLTYAPIHLVSSTKLDFMGNLTRQKQKADRALILGRVFESGTKNPKADEQIGLGSQKAKPIYFSVGGFPDRSLGATTESGMFMYYNLVPTFWPLYHLGPLSPHLTNLRPGFASYVEFGRIALRELKANLVDPFRKANLQGTMPEAQVRFVGDNDFETASDEQGRILFSDLDLPRGKVTLEIEADGYPKTWHDIPWLGLETKNEISLFMAQQDLIDDNALRVAKVQRLPNLGTVIGGAEEAFFKKGNSCVYVTLSAPHGITGPSSTVGPFPLSTETMVTPKGLCLTRLNPAYTFHNVPPGRYVVRANDDNGVPLRSHVIHVGQDRLTVVVN